MIEFSFIETSKEGEMMRDQNDDSVCEICNKTA